MVSEESSQLESPVVSDQVTKYQLFASPPIKDTFEMKNAPHSKKVEILDIDRLEG